MMRRIIVFPAVIVGCMIVIWIGTVATAPMPPQALLAPTLTASAVAQSAGSESELLHEGNPSSAPQADEIPCSLPGSYPAHLLQWCQLIEVNADLTGLPAGLIAAVMLQESGGDHLAYSSSGAVGLMQVMPRDGLAAEFMCINGPCFASRPTITELQDPEFNLAYGSQMLANLYTKTGSLREALFRYGPMDMGYAYADKVIAIWENNR
ncbi:MAG: lytic transglycosylase domain-containing protein [Anaerolineaceae bacterium]